MPVFRSQGSLIYFAHIPKTGGSSVENALTAAGAKRAMQMSKVKNDLAGHGKCTPQHIHAEVYTRYFPKGFFDYAFTIVRNPFARIASEYKMKVLNGKEEASPDIWITQALNRFEKAPFTRDNHIRPQVDFLAPYVDVFKLEVGLKQPIDKALEVLGLPGISKIPHARRSTAEKLVIKKKTLQQISTTYAQDFETLNYETGSYNAFFEIR